MWFLKSPGITFNYPHCLHTTRYRINISTMTGMDSLILTINQLADIQAKNDFAPRDALPLCGVVAAVGLRLTVLRTRLIA
jgi:hypothetical protein